MVDGLRTGLRSLTEELVTALAVGSPEVERAVRLGDAVAELDAEFGLAEDAAVLCMSLAHRILASPSALPTELKRALDYFDTAACLLNGRPGDLTAALVSSAAAGSATAWSCMPGGGPADEVLAAAREAASRCPRGPDWAEPQLAVLQVWADLLRHHFLKDAVEAADASTIRVLADAVLARDPHSLPQRHWATIARALCDLKLGELETGTAGLRAAVDSARMLRNLFELAACLSSLSDQLVRSADQAAYAQAQPLQREAAAAYAAAGDPSAAADAHRVAAMMAIGEEDWESALDSLRRAIPCYEAARERALLSEGPSRTIANFAYVHHAATLCLERLGRLDEAAVAADGARARRLRAIPRAFSPGMPVLRRRAPVLANDFFHAHRGLREAEADLLRIQADPSAVTIEAASDVMKRLRDSRERTRRLLEQVRAVPGVEEVFEQPTLSRIRSMLPAGAIAAYLVPTPHGGVAILVSETTLEALRLPGLTTDCLSAQTAAGAAALDEWRDDSQSPAWEQAITDAGNWAWGACMGPVLERCSGASRLVLLGGGGLEFLPLHAAWCATPEGGKRYAIDVLPISYAPCADLQPRTGDVGKSTGGALLAVADPGPVNAIRLPSARDEAAVIAEALETVTKLEGEQATKDAIVAALPAADIAHLACHARVEFANPYGSFLLAACDARLELSDVIDLELPRRPLVFLSACESGLHDIELADEVQSLAAGFLAAGAAEVIATLWNVFDDSGLLVAVKFYDRRLAGDDGLTALRTAQLWMRDVDNRSKAATINEMAWIDPGLRATLSGQVRAAASAYSSPVYWAPYFYSGP